MVEQQTPNANQETAWDDWAPAAVPDIPWDAERSGEDHKPHDRRPKQSYVDISSYFYIHRIYTYRLIRFIERGEGEGHRERTKSDTCKAAVNPPRRLMGSYMWG